MSVVAFQSAKRLAGKIRRRDIGCLELLDHYLARVERFNPALNAIVETCITAAREQARAADAALSRGEVWGPLHGVPMTVKDSFDVEGLPTTWGVPAEAKNIAQTDALSVARWRKAGAVIFGKTNVPIWLADAQAFNAIYGRTVSPWDPDRTPGGSSGGASAALAAGMTGIEMGSDIAGSIRNPANYCGLYGLKPTFGICPTNGHTLGGNVAPLDILAIGPLGRSADDLAIGLDAIAGPDEIDAAGYRLVLPRPAKKAFREYRIAVIADDPTAPVERAISEQILRLADFLAREGADVARGARPDIEMEDIHRTFDILLRSATSAKHTDAEREAAFADLATREDDDDSKWARMLRGATLSHRDWLVFNEQRHRIRRKWHAFFAEYDLLLCPVSCTVAFRHLSEPPYERKMTIETKIYPFMNQVFWTGFTGVSYLPSVAAPIGFTDEGLPVGVQIVGPQFGDRACIQFARLLERSYQAFVPPPGFD
jgi:amidase